MRRVLGWRGGSWEQMGRCDGGQSRGGRCGTQTGHGWWSIAYAGARPPPPVRWSRRLCSSWGACRERQERRAGGVPSPAWAWAVMTTRPPRTRSPAVSLLETLGAWNMRVLVVDRPSHKSTHHVRPHRGRPQASSGTHDVNRSYPMLSFIGFQRVTRCHPGQMSAEASRRIGALGPRTMYKYKCHRAHCTRIT